MYDTIDHQVADNGGPVPTIKLLPGSPAINAGGQVLGISTDARGIARDGYFSVGAYQGQLLGSSTTTPVGSLAKTGAAVISTVLLASLVVGSSVYVFVDYRRHRRPLVEADPNAHYTLTHHMRVVTIPLIRYRLSFSLHTRSRGSGLVRKF